jgi:hypothetical protein
MIQVTYISTAAYNISEEAVAEILAVSRRNNAAAGLTGLLLYDGRRFLQALEGASASVDAAFQRIKADPRHRAIVLLSSREIGERDFARWAMAAERVDPIEGGRTVAEQVEALTANCADPSVRALFRSFTRVRAVA